VKTVPACWLSVAGQLQVKNCLRDVTYAERWLEGWLSGRLDVDLAAAQAQYATM
jgi:hypothetical protein